MHVELFDISDQARLQAAFSVRLRVFVDEQHVPPEEEVDEHDLTDGDARHALIRDDGEPVAAGRYYRTAGTTAQIGRMAVLASHRGRNVGREMLAALLADARARGFTRAALHAQDHAVAFYAKAGFTPFGATFMECNILHQPMERVL
jgi:predicted GNAT family N-acyltransferase